MSTLTLWTRRDPFAEFDDAFTTLMRRTFGTAPRPVGRPAGFVPAADVTRDGDDAVVRLELPGLDVDNDLTLEVDRGRLLVRGERRNERSEQTAGRALREVRYGSFERSFGLPEHVTADAVTASYDAGVLTVRVSGAYTRPEPTAQRIAVSTGPAPVAVTEAPAENGQSESTSSGEQPAA